VSTVPFEAGREGEPLSEREQRLVKRLFSDPTQIPQDWLPWLKARLEADPPLFSTADIFQLDSKLSAITGDIGEQPTVTIGPTPPGSPADNDIWELEAAGALGENWRFRYNAGSASAFKWEFIGGAEVVVSSIVSDTIVSSSTWTPLTGMALTMPRAGDYDLRGYTYGVGSTAGAATIQLGYSLNSVLVVMGTYASTVNPNASYPYNLATTGWRFTFAAADVVRMMLWHNGADVTSVLRSMSLKPIRVS
jgi:hypothetical protein